MKYARRNKINVALSMFRIVWSVVTVSKSSLLEMVPHSISSGLVFDLLNLLSRGSTLAKFFRDDCFAKAFFSIFCLKRRIMANSIKVIVTKKSDTRR